MSRNLKRSLGLLAVLLAWPVDGWSAPEPPAATAEPEAAPTGVLTRPPELISFVEAVYPEAAFAQGITGEVVLRLTIDETGKVTEVVVDQPAGSGFDEAAVAAVKQFVFMPAEIDGAPAPVQILYRYAFTIDRQAEQVPVANTAVGALSGQILTRGTRAPAVGVAVRLPALGQETTTDGEGRFSFDAVAAGAVVIQVDDAEFYTLEDEETVVAGQKTELRYYVERRGAEGDAVTVVGKRVRKEVARRTLTVEEIRKIPGTSGDALKVVQNLPGVARAPFGGGALIVRGSNPGDSGAVINRHSIPLAFHFGGLRSVFPSELLESIEFYPGNFNSEFGRFTGGIIDVRIRRPKDDGFHGRAEADIFDAGLLIEGPVSENATFALSGRRSYIDAIIPAVLPSDANIDFTVAPRYYDYQALYDWKKGAHRIRLYLFGSDDELSFVLDEPSSDNADVRGTFKTSTGFVRLFAAWNARFSEDIEHELSVSVGRNTLYFSGATDLLFDNTFNVLTLRDDIDVAFSNQFKLRAGVDSEFILGNISARLPDSSGRKEGQAEDGPTAGKERIEVDKDFNIIQPGFWVEAELKLLDDKLLLIPGVRFEQDVELGDYTFDPRLSARYTVSDGTVAKLGAGIYSQSPAPDESDEDFGNPDLSLQHSLHLSAGVEQRLDDAIELDVVGFYKYLYDSVSPVDREATVSTSGDSVSVSEDSPRYLNNGEGRIYGVEVLLRHNLRDRFFGWVSYTLMRSERKDAPGEDYRLFDYDQTHILTALGQYKLTNNWEIGLRWRYVTGNPYTPYNRGLTDTDYQAVTPYAGRTNSERLDAFHQLDLRVDRRWVFNTWILTGYLEIQNAYNQSNPEGVFYNEDYTEQDTITGLPIIPSFGIRGEF